MPPPSKVLFNANSTAKSAPENQSNGWSDPSPDPDKFVDPVTGSQDTRLHLCRTT